MLLVQDPGSAIEFFIRDRATGREDLHPGLLVRVGNGVDDRGREGEVATVLLHRTTLEGVAYWSPERILADFVDSRFNRVDAVDGAPGANPLQNLARAAKEQQSSRIAYLRTAGNMVSIDPATVAATSDAQESIGSTPFDA